MKKKRATWAVVATVKEDAATIERFIAHHKCLGADEIHLFFDEPGDPAASLADKVPGVFFQLCDDAHWKGARPDTHQARQKQNANRVYSELKSDWLIHIDADEFVYAPIDPGRLLAAVPEDQPVLRLRPAELMQSPPGRSVSIFRYALPNTRKARRIGTEAFGEIFPLLEQGLLSHSAGKFFVQKGRPDTYLTIHAPIIQGARHEGVTSHEITLLHFHGVDEDSWLGHLERRLTRGAYQPKFVDNRRGAGEVDGMGRNAYLNHISETQGPEGLRRFYRQVCVFDREKRRLRRAGVLLKLSLWMDEKLETVFPAGRKVTARDVAMNRGTGVLEAEIRMRGQRMIAALEDNYTEISLAKGVEPEAEEMDAFEEIVQGRVVRFWDIGGNAGIYSMICAAKAAPGSVVDAFEPNPVMADRLRRNLSLNGIGCVRVHEVALGDTSGTARLSLGGNLGQATILSSAGSGLEVRKDLLSNYVPNQRDGAFWVFKIDIEGAEPLVLEPFFRQVGPHLWPDAILYEHAHSDLWSIPPDNLFPAGTYLPARVFRNNTLLTRSKT